MRHSTDTDNHVKVVIYDFSFNISLTFFLNCCKNATVDSAASSPHSRIFFICLEIDSSFAVYSLIHQNITSIVFHIQVYL